MIHSTRINYEHSLYNASNRFGLKNSAFRLQNGYLEIEPITRLELDVTVLAWVKLHSHRDHQRLIDFGNGMRRDNLLIALTGLSNPLYFHVIDNQERYVHDTNIFLSLLNWHHIGFVIKGGSTFAYLNGSLLNSIDFGVQNVIRKINRNSCFIGKSNWNNLNANSDYDNIKIFDGALNADQIKDEHLANFD